MGVKSTLTVSIIVDGSLWGMLLFHSYTSKNTPCLEHRLLCDTVSNLMSKILHSIIVDESMERFTILFIIKCLLRFALRFSAPLFF